MDAIYKDDFRISLKSMEEFLNFIKERSENAKWEVAANKDLRFVALDKEDVSDIKAVKEYLSEGAANQEKILADTMQNTQLLLKTKDKVYPVRSCAMKTILERAKINGKALSRLERSVFARILNYCMKVSDGNALIRFADGKASAVLGGDFSDYAILEIPQLFQHTVDYLNSTFLDNKFVGGFYDHNIVSASWMLYDDELIKKYIQLLDLHEIPHEELQSALRLTSSDTGTSGANLYPTLFAGSNRRTIALGSPLKLYHKNGKNGANMSKFDNNLKLVFAQFDKALTCLETLAATEITYPIRTMGEVMKKIDLPRKCGYKALEKFKAINGEMPCTAHEIYYGISEVIFFAEIEGVSGMTLLNLEEKVARALSLNWEQYDLPGEFVW